MYFTIRSNSLIHTLSMVKWFNLGVSNEDSAIYTSTVTGIPRYMIHYPCRACLIYPYLKGTYKWVDFRIGSTDSGTPVYLEKSI